MYIAEYMTADPITVSTATPLPEARRLLNEYRVRHLPVIDGDLKLLGIVTDRDLRSAYPSSVVSRNERHLIFEQVEKKSVADIMTEDCATLSPEATIDDALLIFDRDKIGCIPVVSEENVVLGIFSLLDLISAYRRLFGVVEKGSFLLGIEDDGRERILSEVVTLLEDHSIPVTRLIRLSEKNDKARIFLRVRSPRPVEVYKLLASKGLTPIKY